MIRTLARMVAASAVFLCAQHARVAHSARGDWAMGVQAGSGIMQQPASQYFLFGQSATTGISHTKTGAGIAITVLGRQPFESGPFTEQDYGGMIEFRKRIASWKSLQIAAGFGVGEMRGYVKRRGDNPLRSDYRMGGAATTLQLDWLPPSAGGMTLFLSHTLFSGFSTQMQSQAMVAWPWSFAMAGIGFQR